MELRWESYGRFAIPPTPRRCLNQPDFQGRQGDDLPGNFPGATLAPKGQQSGEESKGKNARGEIELVMRYYKSACEFDETRIHDDFSGIGSEFCDFISSVFTYRLVNKFEKIEIADNLNYKRIMKFIECCKKIKIIRFVK